MLTPFRPAIRARASICAGALFATLALAPCAVVAQTPPARIALVLGEAAYATPKPLPGCAVSAEAVAARLRGLGFDVIFKTDASNGVMGAALIDFAQRVAAPGASVATYFCGYAVSFENRLFLLPVGATIDRRSDVLTQGVPAQSIIDIAGRQSRAALLVLDTFGIGPTPAEAASELSTYVGTRTLGGTQLLVGAVEPTVGSVATPVAQALAAALEKPPVPLDALVAGLRKDLAGAGITLVAAGGDTDVALAPPPPAPPPPPPRAPAPSAASAAPVAAAAPIQPALPALRPPPTAAAPSASAGAAVPIQSPLPALRPPPTAAAPSAAASPATPAMPDEAHYDIVDRRRVQAALKALGYYDGNIDAVFGPDTRAAIRRYQHELKQPMTGTLTPSEATRLVAGSPASGAR